MRNNLMVIDGSGLVATLVYGSLSDFNKAAKLDVDQINNIVNACFRHGNGHVTENVGQAVGKVLNLCRQFECSHCVVLFDKSSATTFRKQMYPAYKAQRQRPDAIKDEIAVVKCILNKVGIPAFWSDKYEADDLAGSIIKQFQKNFDNVYYFSKDRDWFQLLSGNVKGLLQYNTEMEADALRCYYDYEGINNALDVTTPTAKGKLLCINEDIAFDIMGVYSSQVPDYKGLAGDSSDNIPGVNGIGEKTAVALLSLFGDLDGIYSAVESMDEASFKNKVKYLIKKCPYKALVNGKKDAYFYKEIATIVTNLKIPFTKDKLKVNLNRTNLAIAIDLYNLEDDLDYYV